jgi:hypothetical protein
VKTARRGLLLSVNTDNMLSLKLFAVRMNLSFRTAALITQLLRLRLETTHKPLPVFNQTARILPNKRASSHEKGSSHEKKRRISGQNHER